jgi:hypothetical protein
MSLKFYEQTIKLIDSKNKTVISNYAPLLLTVDPFNIRPLISQDEQNGQFQLTSKVYKIVYDWGDGTKETQKIFPSEYSANLSFSYPSTKETGDPRNFPKKHLYTVFNENKKLFFIKIQVYLFGETNPLTYNFELIIQPPRLDGTLTGFFKNFHLIYTKMFGLDNKILYIFEGKEPSWIFPVIADWRPKQSQLSNGSQKDDYYTYQLNI